jgi:uncharacterized protein YabN with tetrapyrrole methylase and pyrophosphatase domain
MSMNRNLRILAEAKAAKEIYDVYVIHLGNVKEEYGVKDFDLSNMEKVYSGPSEDKANAIADKYEKKGYYIEIYVNDVDEPVRGG